jgi:hypothetical protein
VTDEDARGHNGEQPGLPTDQPLPADGAPTPAFGSPPAPPGPSLPPPPPSPPPLGHEAPPTAAPPAPPAYPPGYAPSPVTEPSYQAPAPWAGTAFPPTAPYSPGAAPPGPPILGLPGLANGSLGEPSVPRRRRRMLTILVLVVVVALILAGAGVAVFARGPSTTVSAPGTTTTSPAARQLLQSSLAAARRRNAFHYVAVSSLSGSGGSTQRTVGDAGPSSGRQVITAGKQKFTVIVIGKACYIKGNAAALTANLGLPAASATAHAGQWISLAAGDAPYAAVYAAVTASSALTDNVTVQPETVLPTSSVDGHRVETVSGAIAPITIGGTKVAPKGTATLAVRAAAPHLPVRYTERGTEGHGTTRSTVTFSRWGTQVPVSAPAGAVTYASLGVSSVPPTPSGTVLT